MTVEELKTKLDRGGVHGMHPDPLVSFAVKQRWLKHGELQAVTDIAFYLRRFKFKEPSTLCRIYMELARPNDVELTSHELINL